MLFCQVYMYVHIRIMYVVGAKSLKKAGATEIEIENFSDSEGYLIFLLVYRLSMINYSGC